MATSNPPLGATVVGMSGFGLFLIARFNSEPFTSDPLALLGFLLILGS